jgi:hypothetical protein
VQLSRNLGLQNGIVEGDALEIMQALPKGLCRS